MSARSLGIIFLLCACIQICFAVKVFRLKKNSTSKENEMKIKEINKLSVRIQISLLAAYGVYVFLGSYK